MGSRQLSTPTGDSAAPIISRIELVPAEIRFMIMVNLDLDSIINLVDSSDIFHAQFMRDKKLLLNPCLEATLGLASVDAVAAYQSNSAEFADTCTRETVIEFLGAYKTMRLEKRNPIQPTALSLDDVRALAAFHNNVVRPVMERYVFWVRYNARVASVHLHQITLRVFERPLSTTEKTRFFRTLYRFQTLCNLFGAGRHRNHEHHVSLGFEDYEILNEYFWLFQFWEMEELACIFCFVSARYRRIFERPTIVTGIGLEEAGELAIHAHYDVGEYQRGTVSRGLELLLAVITAKNDAEIIDLLQGRVTLPFGPFKEVLSYEAQEASNRCLITLDDTYEARIARYPLPFRGDILDPPKDPHLYPPLGWTLVWAKTFSDAYGEIVGDRMQELAYVMWDSDRLKGSDADQLFLEVWSTHNEV